MAKNKIFSLIIFAVAVFLAAVYYIANPEQNSAFFPGCPTYKFFGIYCPGCGSQRALHFLLHGEIKTAFRYNPLFVMVFPVFVSMIFWMLYVKFTGKPVQYSFFRNKKIIYISLVFLLLYFVLRNLPFESLSWLQPLK